MDCTFCGSAGSTMKRMGISMVSPGSSTCELKQKHSVLWKNSAAFAGTTDGMA